MWPYLSTMDLKILCGTVVATHIKSRWWKMKKVGREILWICPLLDPKTYISVHPSFKLVFISYSWSRESWTLPCYCWLKAGYTLDSLPIHHMTKFLVFFHIFDDRVHVSGHVNKGNSEWNIDVSPHGYLCLWNFTPDCCCTVSPPETLHRGLSELMAMREEGKGRGWEDA